jgi:hypothetical protein
MPNNARNSISIRYAKFNNKFNVNRREEVLKKYTVISGLSF